MIARGAAQAGAQWAYNAPWLASRYRAGAQPGRRAREWRGAETGNGAAQKQKKPWL